MNARDITLSASLMGVYIAIIIITETTPFKFTGLMLSALFGLFWNYFSLKTNLSFQAGRTIYNFCKIAYASPRIMGIMKLQSIAGLSFLDWVNSLGYPVEGARGYELLMITAKADMTSTLIFLLVLAAMLYCFIIPYLFFRYFKRIGIYKRLQSF